MVCKHCGSVVRFSSWQGKKLYCIVCSSCLYSTPWKEGIDEAITAFQAEDFYRIEAAGYMLPEDLVMCSIWQKGNDGEGKSSINTTG